MNTTSQRLRNKLDLAYPVFNAHAERIWRSPAIRDLYPAYLQTMYTIVCGAVPLMQSALDQAHKRAPHDPVAAQLISYLSRHMEEEAGHDTWLLEDLAATGADPEDPLCRIPSPQVATLVGAQYYWLCHYHPVSLLGHMAVMEGHNPPTGFAKRLRDLTGYPDKAFRAIARHEILDIKHKRELYEIIDSLPLQSEHEKMLGISALHSISSGIDVLTEIYTSVADTSVGTHI
jgi:hypothetical protein